MQDQFGRTIDYMRISITDRCNLRCKYCMPEDAATCMKAEEMLGDDEILRVVRIASEVGIRKIKITGGEPLARQGCAELIRRIRQIPGIEKVTITTNGVLLAPVMEQLAEAGVDGINISLDTLDPEEFRNITGRDALAAVQEGLQAALSYTGIPVKVNCVPSLQKTSDMMAVAGLAKQYPVHVRFIEMMPIGLGRQFRFQGEEEILKLLEECYGKMTERNDVLGNGPCHYYQVQDFKGSIGFISAMTHQFCDRCNRIRMTADGYVKACLQYQTGVDLKALLRGGASDEEIRKQMESVIWNKPAKHRFLEKNPEAGEERRMSQIGG